MGDAEDLFNRLTSGQAKSDQYLAKLSNRGQLSEAEMAGLRASMQTPRSNDYFLGRAVAEMALMSPQERSQARTMGQDMTPTEKAAFVKSMQESGINLNPGQGFMNAMDTVFKAPGVLQPNQLQNIATGQSNVSPYGMGLGQNLYYNPLKGLLNF